MSIKDSSSKLTLSIVIPVYNEEMFIIDTINAVIRSNTLQFKKEVIIIDDGSRDNTQKVVKELLHHLTKKYRQITFKSIYKKTNAGKGAALKDGFLITSGDIVLVQDADLEYNPEDYPILLEPFTRNIADVVYGSRFISNRPHRVLYFWHYLVNILLTILSNTLTNLNLSDMETGYKVFRGDLIRQIAPKLQSHRFGFEPEVTARISKVPNLKIYEVGISYAGRTYQEGKKIGWKDGVQALFQIIKYNLFVR